MLTMVIRIGRCMSLAGPTPKLFIVSLRSVHRLSALLFFTAYLIAQLGGIVYGTGEHLDTLIPWRAERALQVRAVQIDIQEKH